MSVADGGPTDSSINKEFTSMTIYHKHHIVPKHMGGSDHPSNLIELTVEEHAEAHRKLYEEHGLTQDYIAWKALAGQIGKEEIQKAKSSIGGKKIGGWNKGMKFSSISEAKKEYWRKWKLENPDHLEKRKKYVKVGYDTERRSTQAKELNKRKAVCPHCNKEGQHVNMKRWHFDNCKWIS